MDDQLRGRLLRRALHMASSGLLSYYLVSPDLWGLGVRRELLVFTFLVPVWAVESWRLSSGAKIAGMRDNERKRLSAIAWGATGMALGFILFPQRYVIPCVLGMAFIDPLIGELRRAHSPHYPLLIFVFCWAITLTTGLEWWKSILAAVVALASEAPKLAQIDDDFRILIFPMLALAGADWIIGVLS